MSEELNGGAVTCTITLVSPGSSDKVIKVAPARHTTEKIWLDNANGLRRWEAVNRLMQNYAQRGTAVAKPVPWHSDPKNLLAADLKEADIPLVQLDGAVLEKPIEEERAPEVPMLNTNPLQMAKTVGDLASQVAALTNLVTKMVGQNTPAKEEASKEVRVPCGSCDKTFKNEQALKMHVGRFHKEA